MDCKTVQESILTDYIDGQLDGKARARIEAHIGDCAACGEFLRSVRKAEGEIFKGVVGVTPPEYLWSRVKEAVIAEDRKSLGFAEGIFRRVREFVYIHRPALAMATVAVLIVVAGAAIRMGAGDYGAGQVDMQSQAEYLDYLSDVTGNNTANGAGGLGTPLERYFL